MDPCEAVARGAVAPTGGGGMSSLAVVFPIVEGAGFGGVVGIDGFVGTMGTDGFIGSTELDDFVGNAGLLDGFVRGGLATSSSRVTGRVASPSSWCAGSCGFSALAFSSDGRSAGTEPVATVGPSSSAEVSSVHGSSTGMAFAAARIFAGFSPVFVGRSSSSSIG